MNTQSKRALRRHHLQRMKAKAKRVYHFCSPQQAVKYANHLQLCSCHGCGNRRKYEGQSLQEARAKQPEE